MSQVDLWAYERACWEEGAELVCGVDEAGRGPLAGPVCAAAVVLPRDLNLDEALPCRGNDPLHNGLVIKLGCQGYHHVPILNVRVRIKHIAEESHIVRIH